MATLNIGGKRVKVDDAFLQLPPDQQQAAVEEIASQIGATAPPAVDPMQAASEASQQLKGGPGPRQESYGESMAGQGLSGINEGIANMLGAPVELANLAIGAGMSGVNAIAGTDFKPTPLPVGGQQFFRDMMAPTISEETSDPTKQGVRRVAQEVGAMLIPGMGPVARAAKPLKMAAGELTAAVGSGAGAAVAQQAFPGNPLAEFAGQMVGGLTPGAIASKARRATAPLTAEQLAVAKSQAYKAADNAGVAYTPQAYDNMLAGIAQAFQKDRFNPKRHSVAMTVLEDLMAERGKQLSLSELDQLRQIIRRDVVNPSYRSPELEADGHFGQIMLDEIDEMIGRAGQGDVVSGSAANANALITQARELNTRMRKTELIEAALEKAARRAASTGSGGNLNNAIRQNIRAILDSKKQSRAFTKEERAAMENLVRQGKMEDLLRWVGKFAPGGNGLIGMLQVGGTLINPTVAALPVAGMVAKGIADRGTTNKAASLQEMISRGQKPTPLPRPPYSFPLLAAQGSGQIAN
jgi:hypothetical protein